MIEALRNDFKYMVSYNYDTIYSCEESGCNEEGICRCGYITNTQLNSVDVSSIATNVYSEIFDNSISTKRNNIINSLWGISEDIEKYTIDRILRINKVWKPEFWNINVAGGYYGQEVDEVVLIEDVVQKLNTQLEKAFDMDNLTKRIEYLLELENGFILEDIKDKKYRIVVIDIDDIIFTNLEHKSRVLIEDLEHYSDRNYKGIRAIVKKDSMNKWKLIDGYHRLSKTENKLVKVLVVE
jgi:hypothetical protein